LCIKFAKEKLIHEKFIPRQNLKWISNIHPDQNIIVRIK
jgi:hypothetical protein